MEAITVLQELTAKLNLSEARFTLLEHSVGINWRCQHPSVTERFSHLDSGLIHVSPLRSIVVTGNEIRTLGRKVIFVPREGSYVVSLSSKISCTDGTEKHLAMMNLHPEGDMGIAQVLTILSKVTEGMPGYLLRTGRYYHFYGESLLSDREWQSFLAQFLMPTIIVSPRYIGHSLYRGYVALRLTTEKGFKPMLPVVCERVGS